MTKTPRTDAYLCMLLVAVGCGSTSAREGEVTPGPTPSPERLAVAVVEVSDNNCESSSTVDLNKIVSTPYYEANPDKTHTVHVILHTLPATDATDEALLERQAQNETQLGCLMNSVGNGVSIREGVWYEPPATLSNGIVTPIAVAFSAQATFSQMRELTRHPYVASIEPAFGEATLAGEVPPKFWDCPAAESKAIASKIEGSFGSERVPAEVVLAQELPSSQTCELDVCAALASAAWQATIVARRVESCARSWVDASLDEQFQAVALSASARFDGQEMPPFQTIPGALVSFGVMLTRREAERVTQHPFVEAVKSNSNAAQPGLLQCPPNYDATIPPPECPTVVNEAGGSKYTQVNADSWRSGVGPHEVVLSISIGNSCPRPECAERQCAEADQWLAYLEEHIHAEQYCVRSFIDSIGGWASEHVSIAGGSITSTLTWVQIQQVAAHPDVLSIVPNVTSTPPP